MPDPLLCIVCSQVEPNQPPVCTRDRLRLAQALWELRDLHQLLPYALPPGRAEVLRVGGTRERQLPLRTDVLDLAAAAMSTPVLDHDHDQVGAVAVASILDSWAQDWASYLGEDLPDPSVDALVSWLSRRLPWALDNHPAIDEYAKEITLTLYVCRSVLAVSRRPEYSPLACPGCGTAALRRNSGDPSWRCAECKTEVEVEHPETCECPTCKPEEPVSVERYLIPRNTSPEHEASMIAITARLRPLAERPTVHIVLLKFWRDETLVGSAYYDNNTIARWRAGAPLSATHLTVED